MKLFTRRCKKRSSQRERKHLYDVIPDNGTIRLLRLDRGVHSPISGSLVTTTFDLAPPFYAVSYAWGKQQQSVPISLDGNIRRVTPSLAAALHRLRRLGGLLDTLNPPVTHLWIDQICINQDNVRERNHQVSQMRDVYSRSERTLVWLGLDDGFAEAAFNLCSRINSACFIERPLVSHKDVLLTPDYGIQPWRLPSMGLPPLDSDEWKAMKRMFSSPWASRLWVFQEVLLSRESPILLCGDADGFWDDVGWSAHWLRMSGFDDQVPTFHFHRMHMMRETGSQLQYEFLMLLRLTQHFIAADPRDHVFGLLGIWEKMRSSKSPNASDNFDLVPNYSMVAIEVYREIVRWHVSCSPSLVVLSLPMCMSTAIQDLERSQGRQAAWRHHPTWVPNFDDESWFPELFVASALAHNDRGEPEACSLRYYDHFKASADVDAQPSDAACVGNILSLRGLRIDCIVHAQDCFLTGRPQALRQMGLFGSVDLAKSQLAQSDPVRLWKLCSSLEGMSPMQMFAATVESGKYQSPATAAYACFKATTVGLSSAHFEYGSDRVLDFYAYLMHAKTFLHLPGVPESLRGALERIEAEWNSLSEDKREDAHWGRYYNTMKHWCYGRRFFITETGLLGIGSPGLRKRDALCVLFGGQVPYILRRCHSSLRRRQRWLFVGDSYVPELMDGQAITAWRRGKLREDLFQIH